LNWRNDAIRVVFTEPESRIRLGYDQYSDALCWTFSPPPSSYFVQDLRDEARPIDPRRRWDLRPECRLRRSFNRIDKKVDPDRMSSEKEKARACKSLGRFGHHAGKSVFLRPQAFVIRSRLKTGLRLYFPPARTGANSEWNNRVGNILQSEFFC